MREAAIYVRISQDRSDEALGVRRQEVACREKAHEKGWHVAGVYCDNDVSATSNRPRAEYERMVEDIRSGVVNAVVVWDVDRLARKPRDLEDIIDLADQHGTALASVGGEIDLSTPQGKLIARIKGSVARHEADQTSRRARAKQAEIAAAGRYHGGGTRPYGFEEDRVTHCPSEASLIREAADRLLNGATLMSVCQDFTQRGHLTTTGKPWTSASLRKLLLSPRIAGLRQHRDDPLVRAQWDPILDEETWSDLRDAFGKEGRRTTSTTQRLHTWTGLLRCGKCGTLMGPRRIGGLPSYACRRTARNGGCGGTAVRKHPTDEILDELLLRRVERLDLGPIQDESDEDTSQLEEAVLHLEQRLQQLADEFAADRLDPSAFRLASRAVVQRLDAAKTDLREARTKHKRRVTLALDPGIVRDAWPTLPPKERRSIAGAFIDSVIVGPAAVRGRNVFDPKRLSVNWA